VHGKHGFTNNFAADLSPVNLDRIQDWIDQGRLNTDNIITIRELCSSRCIHGAKNGVKLLARNADLLTSRINIVVSRASATAIAAIERLGGTVTTRYYTPMALRRIRQGLMDPIVSTQTLKTSPLVSQWRSQQLDMQNKPAVDEVQQLGEVPAYKYRLPDPARRKDLEYYRDPAHRGYLAYTLKKKEGPSLFMKDKPRGKHVGAGQKEKQRAEMENKIW
jgi:large subunit ribosomal protein L15